MESLAERVRRLRMGKTMTQADLADAAGVSVGAIKLIEGGTSKRPYPDTVKALATALDVSPEELISGRVERDSVGDSDQRTRALGASFRSLRKMSLEQLREAEEYLRLMADDEFN